MSGTDEPTEDSVNVIRRTHRQRRACCPWLGRVSECEELSLSRVGELLQEATRHARRRHTSMTAIRGHWGMVDMTQTSHTALASWTGGGTISVWARLEAENKRLLVSLRLNATRTAAVERFISLLRLPIPRARPGHILVLHDWNTVLISRILRGTRTSGGSFGTRLARSKTLSSASTRSS
jgi:hypothetical protein